MATTYLKRLPASDGSNTTATLSAWVKRGDGLNAGAQSCAIGGQEGTDGNNRIFFGFWGDSTLALQIVNGGTAYEQSSSAVFRDPTAWYHIVARLDTSNGTAQDRVQLFVNGEKITDYTTNDTFPSSVDIKLFENTTSCETLIGARKSSSTYNNISGGAMAHVHIIDGTAYDASAFGETDSTSGIWIAKTSPSVTYGTNGGFYKFASGASGTDSAGSNDMTVVGSLTNLKDNPDNNFATMNSLDNYFNAASFSNANNTVYTDGGAVYTYNTATYHLSKGKWYWEVKLEAGNNGAGTSYEVGIADTVSAATSEELGHESTQWAYYGAGHIRTGNANTGAYSTYTAGDIIGVYLDLDNNKLYFAKNGTIENSGTGVSITAPASLTNQGYFPAACYFDGDGSSNAAYFHHNFGNGYFGTTAVSSSVADAGGEGSFEYDPSSGTFDGSSKDFRALCTNNLATYGN